MNSSTLQVRADVCSMMMTMMMEMMMMVMMMLMMMMMYVAFLWRCMQHDGVDIFSMMSMIMYKCTKQCTNKVGHECNDKGSSISVYVLCM